jgi:proteasome lid subunit RPN8/RPN11
MMNIEITLASSVYEKILLILGNKFTIERIGLCFGLVSDEGRVRIDEFTEIENTDASPSSFSLDYAVMVKQITFYQQKGKSFVGLFHSHPSGHSILPSKKDRHFMQYWPTPFVWLIGVFPQIFAFGFSHNNVYQIPYTLFDIDEQES